MALKDLLKQRGKHKEEVEPIATDDASQKFTFLRTTTNTQELIQPPSYAGDASPESASQVHTSPRRRSRFRSSSNASNKSDKRLSSILHIRSHSRSSSANSINVPTNLPEINDGHVAAEDQEARWAERATILAQQVATRSGSHPISDTKPPVAPSETELSARDHDQSPPQMVRHVSDAISDVKTPRHLGRRA
jgi:hypothetical protein